MPTRTTPRNDTLTGTPLDDLLFGFDGDDVMRGGAGRDVFYEGFARWIGEDQGPEDDPFLEFGEVYDFGAGSDTIFGGAGFDVVRYDLRIGGLEIDVDAGRVTLIDEVDTLRQIEEIRATDERDIAIVGTKGTHLKMQGGRDVVQGVAADGFYHGGRGIDTLDLRGEAGAVVVDVSARSVAVGGDTVAGARSFEVILGSSTAGNRLTGSDADETLRGGAAADELSGGGGRDVLRGFAGDDSLNGGAGADVIDGGAGNDTVVGGSGDDEIRTGDGMDTVEGGDGDDVIQTGAGADTVFDISGFNTITTGGGEDTVTVGFGTTMTGNGIDTIYMIGGGTVFAGRGRDQIEVRESSAVVHGEGGDDRFTLTTGGDFMGALLGGAGTDILVLERSVSLNVRAPLEDQEPMNLVSGFEAIIGSDGGDTISLEENGVSVEARGGSDDISVYSNDNYVDLGGGNNSIVFYGGAGEVQGGANADRYDVFSSEGVVTINDYGGADRLDMNGEAVIADLGDGRDEFYNIACFDPEATRVDLGDGVDFAYLIDNIGFLDLGVGADRVEIDNVIEARIALGAGADVIAFSEFTTESDLELTDFNLAEDRLDLGDVDSLAAFDSVRQVGEDVILFTPAFEGAEFGLRIVLEDTVLGDVTDAIFV